MKLKNLLSLSLPLATGLLIAVNVSAQQDAVPTPATDQPAENALPTTGSEPSITDLEQMMNTASSIKEYQEDLANPADVFKAPGAIERIFQKTKPKFIYFPEGPDPMIIPWERERIIAQEKFAEATAAVANKDYGKSIEILKEIREKYGNTEEGQKAPAEIERVMALQAADAAPGDREKPVVDEGIVFPEWVKVNTTAVMISSTPTVLVGNDFLREGDAVPRYAGIKVKKISDSEVIYLYQDKEYPVAVEGSF